MASMAHLQWIGEEQVRRALSWERLVPEMRRVLQLFSRREVEQPLRTTLNVSDQGFLMVMPGYVPAEVALSTKILTVFPGNINREIATHSAMVIFFNPTTGIPMALIDGDSITELRTAAASAAATQELAPKDTKVVAILGAGIQGKSHARVMNYLLRPKEIRLWSRSSKSASDLAEVLKKEGIPVAVCDSVQEAVKNADVINTCTFASSPILMSEWVKPGAHINSVGAPRPVMQEIDPKLMISSVIYADSLEAAMNESGDVIKSGATVSGEIGEVFDKKKPPRRDETTIFKSLGLAVEDTVSAKMVVDYVKAEGRCK